MDGITSYAADDSVINLQKFFYAFLAFHSVIYSINYFIILKNVKFMSKKAKRENI